MKKSNKFSLDKVTLSPLECDILSVLIEEEITLNQKELSKKTGATFSGISKAIHNLEEKGIIYPIKDSIYFYGINPYRKEEIKRFITGYELGKNKPLVLSGHAFIYCATINDLPERLIRHLEKDPAFIGYCPKGWKYAFRVCLPDGQFKLHKTKKGCKIFVSFRTFGFDPYIIEQINDEKFWRIKEELENEYIGLKIGTVEKIASCPWQEYAILKDYIAVKGIALGIKQKKIEQSYHYPEWEEKGYNASEKIKKIIDMREKEVEELERPLNKSKENNQQDKNKSNEEINEKTENKY